MVEQDAVAGEHSVTLAVVDRDPMGINFRRAIRAAGVERRRFLLRHFLDQPVHLRTAGLVVARLQPDFADRFEDADGADTGDIAGVFGNVEGDADMALGSEMINLIGLNAIKQLDEVGGVGDVPIVQEQPYTVDMGVFIEAVNAAGIKGRGASDDAMDFIPFGEQELGEIGAVLAGDPGDERFFHVFITNDLSFHRAMM